MPLHNARILVVEDEPFIALDLAQAVEDEGGIVIGPAATVSEALDLLGQIRVDGAILDVNLVDRDVSPVARHLLEAGTPIVIQTGVGLPAELSISYPDLRALTKPCSPDELISQLSGLISGRG